MRFLREHEVPPQSLIRLRCSESRWHTMRWGTLWTLLGAGLLYWGWQMGWYALPGAMPDLLIYWGGGSLMFFGLLLLWIARGAWGPSNWILQDDGSHLYFKFRSFQNRHFSPEDCVVAVIPHRDIAWMRVQHERREPRMNADDATEHWTCLEFALRDANPDVLRDHLVAEQTRRLPGFVTHRMRHSPVQLAGTCIRIPWRSHQIRVVPALAKVLAALGTSIAVQPEVFVALQTEE